MFDCGSMWLMFKATLPMWLIVGGAFVFFKACRIWHNYCKRTKRAW